MRVRLAAAALFALSACAHGETREGTSTLPASGEMELDEAERIVELFEKAQATPTINDPLRSPRNVDDLWEILKRDQLDLFPGAIAWAKAHDDLATQLIAGQVELAWSDAQNVLSIVVAELSWRVYQQVRDLEAREATDGVLDVDSKAKLRHLRESVDRSTRLVSALRRLSREHMWRGAKIARALVNDVPQSYAGYRLMADFYRLRGSWDQVEEMLVKAQEKNRGSNGVTFLRGIVALEHGHNRGEAQALFRQALERDPGFNRARVWLLLTYPSLVDALDEFALLKQHNPHHQLVVWAGPLIEEAKAARTEGAK